MSDALSSDFIEADVETSVANGRLLAYLAKHGEVLSRTFTDERVTVHCRVPKKYLGRISEQDAQVRPRGETPAPPTVIELDSSAPATDDSQIGDVA